MTLVFLMKSRVKFKKVRVLQGQLPERNRDLVRQEDVDDQTDPPSRHWLWTSSFPDVGSSHISGCDILIA